MDIIIVGRLDRLGGARFLGAGIFEDTSMGRLLKIHEVDEFADVRAIPDAAISGLVLSNVRDLDEETDLEPAFREILYDPNETPHGPTEIADILTHRFPCGPVQTSKLASILGNAASGETPRCGLSPWISQRNGQIWEFWDLQGGQWQLEYLPDATPPGKSV
jgi:hypothetical protein